METRHLIIAAVAFLTACTSAQKRSDSESASATQSQGPAPVPAPAQGTREEYGPPAPPQEPPPPAYGPEPILYRPIILVLSPGLARGYAHAGVIRALVDAKIPIGAIYGAEMGGLIGALYASDAKINQFEWALQKFREESFTGGGAILDKVFKTTNNGGALEKELSQVFANQDLSQLKIPTRIAIQPVGSNAPLIPDRGPVADILRCALAIPQLIKPCLHSGGEATSHSMQNPTLVSDAKNRGTGAVVVVDVSPNGAAIDAKAADLVIRPDLQGIGPNDFKKRTDAIFRGKTSIKKHLKEIRHLVGLPQELESN